MSTTKERIKIVLNAYRFSVSKLAGGYCNGTQTKLNRQINGDSAVTGETLEHVLNTFPNLSAEWLMRGEGSMYKMDHRAPLTSMPAPEPATQLPQPPKDETEKNLEEIIALQKDAILQRDKRIELLESLLGAYRSGSLA